MTLSSTSSHRRIVLLLSILNSVAIATAAAAYDDYSFVDQSCESVTVRLDIPSLLLESTNKGGVIHSPNYNTFDNKSQQCSWNVIAPATNTEYQLQVIFVDLEATEDNCASLVLHTDDSSIKLSQVPAVSKLSACDVRPFTRALLLGNQFTLTYSSSNLRFLLYFELVPKSSLSSECDNINQVSCQSEILNAENVKISQTTCIDKKLLCSCDWLTESQSNSSTSSSSSCDSLLNSTTEGAHSVCSTYSTLNRQCWLQKKSDTGGQQSTTTEKSSTTPSPPPPAWLSYCSNVFRTNEFGWLASPNLYNTQQQQSAGNNGSSLGAGGVGVTYPPGLNCTYHIIMQPYQTIQIRLKYFYLNSQSSSFVSSDRSSPLTSQIDDYDSVSIYDGPSTGSPLIARLTSLQNDFDRYLAARTFNSKSNIVLIVFHSSSATSSSLVQQQQQSSQVSRRAGRAKTGGGVVNFQKQFGFNLTYQIKGFCIEDQRPCNSLYELNCYSPQQVCNDVWDCQNGADERGCEPCKADQFKCRNHIFCFRADERCDGDHQCMDKSDELGCDKWQCNPDNGTFLCANGRCIYEQWQCDGTVDCEDGSDELNCPSTFSTRRVITTAVLGGTLCCLLLVMALGCACKLYSLHTISYRSSMRFSHHHQTASSSASTQPLMGFSSDLISGLGFSSNTAAATSPRPGTAMNNRSHPRSSRVGTIFRRLLRRRGTGGVQSGGVNQSRGGQGQQSRSSLNSTLLLSGFNSISASHGPSGIVGSPTNQTSLLNSPAGVVSNNDQQQQASTSENNEASNNMMQQILPPPHHLIAPPTYNQTMGLVDEYEQRQLAFLEHVRTILSQQQQQQQQQGAATSSGNTTSTTLTGMNGAATITSISLIPTVSSSSTTVVHRQTTRAPASSTAANSSSRRSHRHHRHHRHHHHRSVNNTNNNDHQHQQLPGYTSSSMEASSSVANTSEPDSSNNRPGQALSSSSSRHRHRHVAGRSNGGLSRPSQQQQQQFSSYPFEQTSNQQSQQNDMISFGPGSISLNGVSSRVSDGATTSGGIAAPTASSTTSTALSNSASANLRDKIAKLIKDIVVNNNAASTTVTNNGGSSSSGAGEYEQIPSMFGGAATAAIATAAPLATGELLPLSLSMSSAMDQCSSNSPLLINHNRRPTTISANTHSSSSGSSFNNTNNTNNEDDVPLIQP